MKPVWKKKTARRHDRFGLVRVVAAQWSSSNDSITLNFDYDLHQFPPRTNHDTIFLITTPVPT